MAISKALVLLLAGLSLLSVCAECSSSSSGGDGGSFPHDALTQSELTSIYNEVVVTAEHMRRPLQGFWGWLLYPLIRHEGVRLTTELGNQYLVHKGDDYGICSQTVVVHARHMSSDWDLIEEITVTNGMTVGDAVEEGGSTYDLSGDNCYDAADRIMDRARQ